MGLADEIASRFKKGKGGSDEPESSTEADDEGDEDATARAAGKALIAAVRKGDVEAVIEAVRAIR